MPFLALASIVCGAWFKPLPPGWHQSAPAADVLVPGVGAQVHTWAASFKPSATYGISRGFPPDGVYIGVNLIRPPAYGNTWLIPRLRLPLQLRLADIGPFPDPRLTMYRVRGRYGRQYNVDVQVLFRRPTRSLLQKAQLSLNRVMLPRWIPRPSRCRG